MIIDTFGALRSEDEEKKEDQDNVCFICGLGRETFERERVGKAFFLKRIEFNEHLHLNHYMWNYVYYIAYLSEKDSTEFSGLESKVWSKYLARSTEFFPQQVALSLMRRNKIEKNVINKKLDIIVSASEDVERRAREIQELSEILF